MLLMSLMMHPAGTCPYAGRGWGIEHGERFVPSILGSQQVLYNLAYRTMTARCGGHKRGNRSHFSGRIMHCHRVAACAHRRKIGKIIANKRHRIKRHAACMGGGANVI
jgi:hypothetical protein